jgi:hypothetical protein
MRRWLILAVCLVMLGMSLVVGSGTASADGVGTVTTDAVGWCRGC